MKKISFFVLVCLALAIFAFDHPKNSLVGRWTINYRGDHAQAEFKADGSFTAIDDHGGFDLGGKYKIKDGVLYIVDSTCGDKYWGKYKQTFVTEDSIFSVAIADSCFARKIVLDGATMNRKKM
ncbi:MAG TPA: hypothetical protein VK563_17470 [Puia sp.]|nr:hypothetical protein [Puia sp.]